MTSKELSERAKETWKSVKGILERADAQLEKELIRVTPRVKKSLETSYEATGKALNSAMNSIDGATESEQGSLLRSYKRFLSNQVDFVEGRLYELESRPKKNKS